MTLDAPPGPPPSDPDKIKLGYLSVDFRDHPVGHIVERLYAHHDRERFIVTAYSIGCDDESDYRARIAQNCDRFVDLRDLTDLEAANRIRADGTNVLIDLTGFTEGFRMGIMALKPAPVQASYLGFPGTTGAAFIDYLIADAVVCPPQDDAHYQESVVRLPASYMLCPYRDLALGSPPTRASAGLKDDQIVFCSFNQMYKIDPVLFDAWMAIVRAVDNSVLWLPDRGAIVQENLRREAEARKVAPDRIVFSERCDALSDHLSRLRLADIALDTRLYNGHVTTIDALFAGVPVITAAGDHFPSRAAASILQAAGLPDLVANDLDEYCATAIALARSPKTLESVRDRISGPSRASPIFDPAKFAGDIESAFDVMWRNHVAGNDPAPIEIR